LRAAPGGRTWIAQRRDELRRYALDLRLTSACGVHRLRHGGYRHQQRRRKACAANEALRAPRSRQHGISLYMGSHPDRPEC
jgi:hypothetical protein